MSESGATPSGESGRPDGWPEMYSAAGRSGQCPHQMHWDDGDSVYRCIYECGEVDEEPPENKIVATDGGDRLGDTLNQHTRDKLEAVEKRLAAANAEIAAAVEQSTGLLAADHPEFQLRNTHTELLDAYRELVQTIDMVERVLGEVDEHSETPKQIISDHGDRLGETYDEPLSYIAVQLANKNRRKWLHAKPETNGAQAVERHGLTENQRRWLNNVADE